jgi:hypothetical protein
MRARTTTRYGFLSDVLTIHIVYDPGLDEPLESQSAVSPLTEEMTTWADGNDKKAMSAVGVRPQFTTALPSLHHQDEISCRSITTK